MSLAQSVGQQTMRPVLFFSAISIAALVTLSIFTFSIDDTYLFQDSAFTYLLDRSITSTPNRKFPSSLERNSKRRYLNYDEVGPKPIPGTARSHALPNAVPISRTIPRLRQYAENKSYHISQRGNTSEPLSIHPKRGKSVEESLLGTYNWNHSYDTDYRTLYLYNPSILPLHNTISGGSNDNDPDNLSKEDLDELTGGDPSVRYVAIYRAYTGCNCFGPDPEREIMKAGEQLSYLAVALLNESLDVVPGTDILIDLNAGPVRGKYWRQFIEDCRIFSLRGGIYLLCNEEMKRVRIRRRMRGQQRDIPPEYGTRENQKMPYVYPNIHGYGLEVTLLGHNVKVGGGKNFNIFRSLAASKSADETSTGPFDYYLQTYPSPHRYRRLKIPDGKEGDIPTRLDVKLPDWPDDQMSPGRLPHPSFDTPDARHPILKCADGSKNCTDPVQVPFFGEDDHGTACCVHLNLPSGSDVMVGISHQKLSPRDPFWLEDVKGRYEHFGVDRFVSRFVAYDSNPPFDVVARSGWFCIGFADEEESNKYGGSSLAGRNTNATLDLFGMLYACPVIHFVIGFAEVVGDNSKAIIGYGVNDCHPRMFFVEKTQLATLLMG